MCTPGIIGGTCSTNSYGQIINNVNIALENENFKTRNKNGSKSFIRDRVFTFKTLVVFIMTQLQRAVQRELDDFINLMSEPGSSLYKVSKAAFTKARKKLKYTAFVELNDIIVQTFYKSTEDLKYWRGFRLLAGDGSTVEVPNSDELVNKFGVHTVRPDGKIISLARLCQLYDPLNNVTISAEMDAFKATEAQLLWKMVLEKRFGKDDLFILDRYFFSTLFLFFFDFIGAQYCFRVKKNLLNLRKLKATNQKDGIFEFELSPEFKEEAKKIGITAQKVKCRLSIIELDNGDEEYLLTSFLDQENVSLQDLKELYFLRWGVENRYLELKHKICLGNFSGKSLESVYQDYYAKIFMLNLTSMLVRPVDEKLKEEPKEKYYHQVNFTDALGKVKYAPVFLFIKKQAMKLIEQLHQWFLSSTEPVRKGRSFKRYKRPSTKYHMNYKRP